MYSNIHLLGVTVVYLIIAIHIFLTFFEIVIQILKHFIFGTRYFNLQ